MDEQIVKLARKGDKTALREILRALETPLYQTAYYLTGNEQDALDATQEALWKIYRSFASFRGDASVRTWAQKIITHTCWDFLRKKRKEREWTSSLPEHEPSTGSYVDQASLSFDMRQAIQLLPPHQRTALTLRYIHDYELHYIAEIMEMPINTVKSHLYRARQQLQKMLANYREGRDAKWIEETKTGSNEN